MKIGFICTEYPPGPHGGVGTAVQMLARGLVRQGHSACAIGFYPKQYPNIGGESDQGVEVERLPRRSWRLGWIADRVQLFRRFRRLVAEGVEIIEAPADNGWLALWPQLRVPCIIRAQKTYAWHATGAGPKPNPRIHWLEGQSLRRAEGWIAVSHYTAEMTRRVHGLDRGPDALVYNAVDIACDSPHTERREEGLVVYAGTLTHKKGIISLVEAFNRICELCPKARLEIYGKDLRVADGVWMTTYLAGLQSSAAHARTLFAGHVSRSDLFGRLRTASATVFPSYGEAFGFVAVEAMALGCPVIYTKRTCGPEIIQDGVDGLLVDPADPADISRAILALLEDPALGSRLGRAAMNTVQERFAMSRWLAETEKFYEDMIERHRDGSA